MAISEIANKLMNNYVFQNRFRQYFHSNLQDILLNLSTISQIDKCKSISYSIEGNFGTKHRIINFPNIFSYAYAVKKIDSLNITDFGKINSSINKMEINYSERKFKSNSYSSFLEERLNLLISDYDKLYKIDIQSFYKSIYTHVFDKLDDPNLSKIDEYIRVFNNKKTNGLLLGNLLSTYAANEIMEYLSRSIQFELSKSKIFYFSDQFYIFYNELDYTDNYVNSIVSKIIGKDYFELKINDNDSKIFNHETLLTSKDFIKKVNNLVKLQKTESKDIDKDLNCLLHFYNAFIEYYYTVPQQNRLSFVEVVLKNVFTSTFNLYRFCRYLSKTENKKDVHKIISILILFLKNHPSLIIFYIEIGIWDAIEENSDYLNIKKIELKKYFEEKLLKNINTIEAVYYFHICYKLTNKENKESYCLNFYQKNMKKNNLLDSIIIETCNIKEKRSIVINYPYNTEDWLLNYTKLMQIRYYLEETVSSNCLIKTINMCKKKKIKIIKSLDDINYDKSKLNEIKEKFE